ncbi:MAG: hypothetical protein JWO00_247 [Candidatus Parcubacteria bacterium]|nr:hypothetical protein [Candidatus Parcubacteria bacterium]
MNHLTPQRLTRRSFQNGYTLLFAVLTAALVLGVAVFILSVATKQYELSASARNSIYSFYAADTGIECASAAYSGENGGTISSTTGATVTCGSLNGVSQTVTVGPFVLASSGYPPFLVSGVNKVYQTPNTLNFNLANGTCAVVTLYDGFDSSGNHYMIFDSRGYNHCTSSAGPDTSSPTTVERALRLTKKG